MARSMSPRRMSRSVRPADRLQTEVANRFEALEEGADTLRREVETLQRSRLYQLSVNVANDRRKAALEAVISGMPTSVSEEDREHVVYWMMDQAGIEYSRACSTVQSHKSKGKQLTHLTILRFLDEQDKERLTNWWRVEYKDTGERLAFWKDDEPYHGGRYVLTVRPQIALWDRLRSVPLKVAVHAIQQAASTGRPGMKSDVRQSTSSIKVQWDEDALYFKGRCLVWLEFSVEEGTVRVYALHGVYDAIKYHWKDTWAWVYRDDHEHLEGGKDCEWGKDSMALVTHRKGQPKGFAAGLRAARSVYPFQIHFAEVENWSDVEDFKKSRPYQAVRNEPREDADWAKAFPPPWRKCGRF